MSNEPKDPKEAAGEAMQALEGVDLDEHGDLVSRCYVNCMTALSQLDEAAREEERNGS